MALKQQTLCQTVSTKGVGLHSGVHVNLHLKPAVADTGIIYRRIDLYPPVDIPGNAFFVGDTQLSSTLVGRDKVCIATIEHLSSAIYAFAIDNLIVEVDGPEIPILDGSAYPFCELLERAGTVTLEAEKKLLKVDKPIRVDMEGKWASLEPCTECQIDMMIDFKHSFIQRTPQHLQFTVSPTAFYNGLSRARTFGFLKDIESLKQQGRCLGGDLSSAIVLDKHGMINQEPLRFPDEFVRHKIIDAIGDLFTCGYQILGKFSGYRTGHTLNNQLVRLLLSDTSCWSFTSEYPT